MGLKPMGSLWQPHTKKALEAGFVRLLLIAKCGKENPPWKQKSQFFQKPKHRQANSVKKNETYEHPLWICYCRPLILIGAQHRQCLSLEMPFKPFTGIRTAPIVKYFKPKLQICWDLLQIPHLAIYLLSSKSSLSFCSVNLCQSIVLVLLQRLNIPEEVLQTGLNNSAFHHPLKCNFESFLSCIVNHIPIQDLFCY